MRFSVVVHLRAAHPTGWTTEAFVGVRGLCAAKGITRSGRLRKWLAIDDYLGARCGREGQRRAANLVERRWLAWRVLPCVQGVRREIYKHDDVRVHLPAASGGPERLASFSCDASARSRRHIACWRCVASSGRGQMLLCPPFAPHLAYA